MRIKFIGLMFVAIFALCGNLVFAQSRDRENPTPISGTSFSGNIRDDNRDGAAVYYFKINVEPGSVHAMLNYTSPPGVTSMSVFFSGVDCCPPESELGGSSTTAESTFRIQNRQTLLIEVYVDSEFGREVPFTLRFEGSVGGPGGTTICTDLSIDVVTYKVEKVGTKDVKVTITGILANESTGDFVSGDGQQSIRVQEKFSTSIAFTTIYTQPFTTVRTRGRLAFATTKTYKLADFISLKPSFKVSIIYDGEIGSDNNPKNDDCVPANNIVNLPYKNPR